MEKSGDTDLIVISDHITDQQHGLDMQFVPLSFCVFHCKLGTVEVPLGYWKDYIHRSFSWLIKSSDFWLSYYIPLFWASRKTLVSKNEMVLFLGKYVHFSSVQSLSCVWLFATPWNAARQASLSITNSGSSLRLTSIKSLMPSSHLILDRPLLLLPPISFPVSLFQWVNSSHKVAKVLEFQL